MGGSMGCHRHQGLGSPCCEIELAHAPKGSTARDDSTWPCLGAADQFSTATARLGHRVAGWIRSITRIRAPKTKRHKDEIFVMLFCRSAIQSPFMRKAQSFHK